MSRRKAILAAQLLLAAAIVWYAADRLSGQWSAVAAVARTLEPRWWILAASGAVVLATYAVLIETWRTVVRGWGATLSFGDAARIWTISNLGRYVPGKVWQLGTMAMMAQQRGVSGVVAAGSALVVTIVNLIAGFVVAAATGARILGFSTVFVSIIAIVAGAVLLTPSVMPRVLQAAARATGRTGVQIPMLPARTLWIASATSALAWVMYGVAFRLLTIGVLGSAAGALTLYIAVFTGSYVLGFLALVAPAGVGVRETAMATALVKAGFATAPATVLVLTSRLWLTILELVPALLFLAHGTLRATRTHAADHTTPP